MSRNISALDSAKSESDHQEVSVIDLPKHAVKDVAVPFEDALREIGFGKVHWQILAVVSLILLQVINESMGVSFLLPAAQCDLDLTTSSKGFLTGTVFFGIMISSYPMGFLGDTQGRRFIILISLACSSVFTVLSAFMKSYWWFVVCRFFVGIFVAGYSATSYAYIGEFNTNKNRATILSWVSVSIGFGMILLPLIALWILSYEWSFELYDGYAFRPWRLLMLIYALPGMVGGTWLYFMPESPKYLLTQNRNEEALEIVRWMYRTNKGQNPDNMKAQKIQTEVSEKLGKNYKGAKAIMMSLVDQTLPLFRPPHVLNFLTCSLLHFGTFSIAGGMALFVPDTFNKLSQARMRDDVGDLRICDVLQMHGDVKTSNESTADAACVDYVNPSVFLDSSIIGVGFMLGFIVLSLTIKALGRRKIFVVTLLLSTISGCLLVVVDKQYLIIIFYMLFVLLCGINVTVINGAAIDLFPTHLRAMAVCVSMMFGRLGSTVSSNLIGYLLERNCELTYYVFSGVVFVCFLVSFIIPDNKQPAVKKNKSVIAD